MKTYKCIESYSIPELDDNGRYIGDYEIEKDTIWEEREDENSMFTELKRKDTENDFVSISGCNLKKYFKEESE